jgi:hypothetical protein
LLVLLLITAVLAAGRGLWSPCGLSMVSSLNPVSERARGHRFGLTAAWYVAGAVAGGAALGAGCALGAYGVGRIGPSSTALLTAAAAAALVAVASDARLAGWSLPDHPRQVDERWLTAYRRWIYAAGYGLQIGSGFATYIMSAAVYLTAALAVLTGSATQALAAGLLFGLVRGLGIALAAGARDPDALRGLLARLDAWAAPSVGVACAVQAAVATAAAWLAAGPAAAVAVALVLAVVLVIGGRRERRPVPVA